MALTRGRAALSVRPLRCVGRLSRDKRRKLYGAGSMKPGFRSLFRFTMGAWLRDRQGVGGREARFDGNSLLRSLTRHLRETRQRAAARCSTRSSRVAGTRAGRLAELIVGDTWRNLHSHLVGAL